ncbi:MAG: hypothetical protein CVU89_15585 [Firmicutes bacterium HGW-Firmicutes-14]|nr:MAG: hypothetical protein CVU89_15585 [Firmicutes bacterium HGW-Firmicutes-14]
MDIAYLGEISRDRLDLGGGKGASLSEMVRAGLPVPPGFVVCAGAFTRAMSATGISDQIAVVLDKVDYENNDSLNKVSGEIKELIRSKPLPPSLVQEIESAYEKISGENPVPVAVRSSATCEDLSEASFAGQQETFLYVLGKEDVHKYIRECWASLYNARAIFYRKQKGFDEAQISIAVVIQKMVNSERAGVLFTVNPVTKDTESMVIEGTWGLGEAVVSGFITPDFYLIDKTSGDTQYVQVSKKDMMIVPNAAQKGTVKKEVPVEKREKQVLADSEILQLVGLGKKLEEYMGCPQDIEWAIEAGKVYLLQSRAITTL